VGATCSDYGEGLYFKSLYQFTPEGEVWTGSQFYQDASCTTVMAEGYNPPVAYDYATFHYAVGNSATLPDGTNGYGIHFEIAYNEEYWGDWDDGGCASADDSVDPNEPDAPPEPTPPPAPDGSDYPDDPDDQDDPSDPDDECGLDDEEDDFEDEVVTGDAYFNITNNALCFTNNVLFETEVVDFDQGDGSSVDYEHCLSVHSSVGDASPNPGPNPDPDPTPSPATSPIEGHIWYAYRLCLTADGTDGSLKHAYEFVDGRMVRSEVNFATTDCSGNGTFSDTSDDGTYRDLGAETLPDGAAGHRLEIVKPGSDPSSALVGFYLINGEGELCLSNNLGLNNVENLDSTDVDYEHCLPSLEFE
jgi:hypothetical protein